jgi:hypothetical protein
MPLVNEVVIGLPDKDKFNGSKPKDDGQFATYVTNPTLPALVEIALATPNIAPTNFPRTDLVTTFLTGITGVNQPKAFSASPATGVASEMLRLNTAIPPTTEAAQNRLGLLGGLLGPAPQDLAGYPNGRRPSDDVVDISLILDGGLASPTAADTYSSARAPGCLRGGVRLRIEPSTGRSGELPARCCRRSPISARRCRARSKEKANEEDTSCRAAGGGRGHRVRWRRRRHPAAAGDRAGAGEREPVDRRLHLVPEGPGRFHGRHARTRRHERRYRSDRRDERAAGRQLRRSVAGFGSPRLRFRRCDIRICGPAPWPVFFWPS